MMDPHEGRFDPPNESNQHLKRFTVGETLKLKGEEFEVIEIRPRAIILKPMSAFERGLDGMRRAIVEGPREFEPDYDGPPRNRAERRRVEALKRKSSKGG